MLTGVVGAATLAKRGTPIMRDYDCGFVVIAMSPKDGYWDVEAKRTLGYILQNLRTVFGMCKPSCHHIVCYLKQLTFSKMELGTMVRVYLHCSTGFGGHRLYGSGIAQLANLP